MRRVELAIKWDLEALLQAFECSSRALDAESARAPRDPSNWLRSDGGLAEGELQVAAAEWCRAMFVVGLNSVVDGALLILANQLVDDEETLRRGLRRARSGLISDLESVINIDVRTLGGWAHVEALREDANALKHRAGYMMPVEGPEGIHKWSRVDLADDLLVARGFAIWTWLDQLCVRAGYQSLGEAPSFWARRG